MSVTVRDAAGGEAGADAGFVVDTLTRSWGMTTVVSAGRGYDAATLPALVAELDGAPVGLLTYDVDAPSHREVDAPSHRETADRSLCVVSLDATVRRQGVGASLLAAAASRGRELGCDRMWLTTTNELTDAIAFYLSQRMRLVEVRLDAVAADRAIKPSLPTHDEHGTPIRDVWVFEQPL